MIRLLMVVLTALVLTSEAMAGNRSQPASLSASASLDGATQFTLYSYQLKKSDIKYREFGYAYNHDSTWS